MDLIRKLQLLLAMQDWTVIVNVYLFFSPSNFINWKYLSFKAVGGALKCMAIYFFFQQLQSKFTFHIRPTEKESTIINPNEEWLVCLLSVIEYWKAIIFQCVVAECLSKYSANVTTETFSIWLQVFVFMVVSNSKSQIIGFDWHSWYVGRVQIKFALNDQAQYTH